MSLEQVDAFYDFVARDQAIYEQYYNSCCIRGLFGVWNWDKANIVNFAASLGFEFTEIDLDIALFESGAGAVVRSSSSTSYEHVSAY